MVKDFFFYLQVKEIPFPYTSTEQFEKSIRAPLGKTWNPETVHRQLVKPKVVTQMGKIITPIDRSEVFDNKKPTGGTQGLTGAGESEEKEGHRGHGSSRMKMNKRHKGKGQRQRK